MTERDWPAIEQRHYMPLHRRQPVTLVRGRGCEVWDDRGRRYLDLVGGWAVNSVGHCHPTVVAAVQRQAAELMMTSNQFYTIPQLALAERLARLSGLERVYFQNSGAEANEGAVKLARRWGSQHRGGAYEVITAWRSFHGRTLAMVAATGKPAYQEPFRPLPAGFRQVEFNDLAALRAAIREETVAVMLEPVQGEGGVWPASVEYLQGVRALCDELGLLLILDEVQTGIGRTGTLFAFERYGIRPDILTLGKALGGGLPIGAFLAREEVAHAFRPGDHGSTFGGNPVVCAAGLATLEVVEREELPARAARLGEYFTQRLHELAARVPVVREVRGAGLLLALEFTQEWSEAVTRRALERGLLLNAVTPSAVRLMPPLVIREQEIDEAVAVLEAVLAEQLVAAP
ncbi:MAG: acetylornithine transaminase [Chloroflexi bacterium]|nr:acetylornithine transaminase [Chloroflexota bacterium]